MHVNVMWLVYVSCIITNLLHVKFDQEVCICCINIALDVSQFIKVAAQNELQSMVTPNEAVITSHTMYLSACYWSG